LNAERWLPLDLSSSYNHKGVSWIDRGVRASINHIGESLAGELLPNGDVAIRGGIPFRFPATDGPELDMISLEGQRLELPEGRYERIAFVGFSTWGDFHDSLSVVYGDGTSEERPFGFNDWQEFLNSRDVPKVGMDYYRYLEERIERPTKLEILTVELDPERLARALLFPDNTYTYVLSISLLPS